MVIIDGKPDDKPAPPRGENPAWLASSSRRNKRAREESRAAKRAEKLERRRAKRSETDAITIHDSIEEKEV